MSTLPPKVFVGSSSEAKDIANAFCRALSDTATLIPWWQSSTFETMHATLDGLRKAADEYDFGLFILTPDDEIESKGKRGKSARDNVLFELGLFLGTLGPDRTFAVMQDTHSEEKRVKVPSDLAGVTIPRFTNRNEDDLIASVNSVAHQFRRVIRKQGRKPLPIKIKRWAYDQRKRAFFVKLSAEELRRYKARLEVSKLALVARKRDERIAATIDEKIVCGTPQEIPSLLTEDFVLNVPASDVFGRFKKDDLFELHLLLIPRAVNIDKSKTISEMLKSGCEDLM